MRALLLLAALLISGVGLAQSPQGLFLVGGSGSGPQPNSITAAISTAGQTVNNVYTAGNSLCDAIAPFYWEIGNASGPIGGGAVYKTGQTAILQASRLAIASASKMIYGMFVANLRAGSGGLTSTDISYLHMTAGYTNLGSGDGTGASCPKSLSPRDISTCLAQINAGAGPGSGQAYDWQNPADIGHFSYSGSQMEVHARDFAGLSGLSGTDGQLNTTIIGAVAAGTTMQYSQPLVPGGLYASAADYAIALRGVLNGGALAAYLGTATVCANPGGNYSGQTVGGSAGPSSCDATSSPITAENWQYSMAHWVETDPAAHGDGAFSSPGSFGFYPWIDASKTYYGVFARKAGGGSGYASAQCGRLIRRAFVTGVNQTGTIPTS